MQRHLHGAPRRLRYNGPRTPDRKPDLNGIWQVLGTAHWNLEAHSAIEGVPAGLSVVEGGAIPYQPAALAKRNENFQNRLWPIRSGSATCPACRAPRTFLSLSKSRRRRSTSASPTSLLTPRARSSWTGRRTWRISTSGWATARGQWEGDTLVVDTVSLGDQTWFDQAGNFHSDALKVIERFTPIDATPHQLRGDDRDPKVFTRPWKMNMIIYRRLEKNLELLDYECAEHIYQKLFKERAGKP